MNRRQRARRLALQGLCCMDVQHPRQLDLIDEFIDRSGEPAETLALAKHLLRDVHAECPQCDAFLARHARHWDLARLALIDRNILRLAVYELLTGEIPYKVVISEALKLAQDFSTAESPRFVNGILDAIAKEIREDTGQTED